MFGAFVSGWFLTVETTGLAFDGRGLRLRERRRMLRSRRAMTLGFGIASYLVFLIPAGAALAMPAVVAGRRPRCAPRRASSTKRPASTKPHLGEH